MKVKRVHVALVLHAYSQCTMVDNNHYMLIKRTVLPYCRFRMHSLLHYVFVTSTVLTATESF